VVGVVGNVKYGGLDEETPAEIYLPYEQQPVDAFTVAVRTPADPFAIIPTLRRDVAEEDPLLPLATSHRSRHLSTERSQDVDSPWPFFWRLPSLAFTECSRISSACGRKKLAYGSRSAHRRRTSFGYSFAKGWSLRWWA